MVRLIAVIAVSLVLAAPAAAAETTTSSAPPTGTTAVPATVTVTPVEGTCFAYVLANTSAVEQTVTVLVAGSTRTVTIAAGTSERVTVEGDWGDMFRFTDDAGTVLYEGVIGPCYRNRDFAVTIAAGTSWTSPVSGGCVTGDPPHGTARVTAEGPFVYTPDPGFTGTDTFHYSCRYDELEGDVTITVVAPAASTPPVVPPQGAQPGLAVTGAPHSAALAMLALALLGGGAALLSATRPPRGTRRRSARPSAPR